MAAGPAAAQSIDLGNVLPQAGGTASGRIVQLVGLLTVLSIAPGLLVMVTSFTRFAIAFSFLRSGLGLQTTPANIILVSLSLFMTFYVMAPTFDRAYDTGLRPLLDGKIAEGEAYTRITGPFREFMLGQVRDKDLKLFDDLAPPSIRANNAAAAGTATPAPAAPGAASPAPAAPGATPPAAAPPAGAPAAGDRAAVDLRVLIPAFMISEIRRGFEIGFLIALPFLVIDLVVSTITMSMGMMMLSPSVISLPLKVLFFVLIDGWNMLVGSLIRSYS
ncbi:flagellar type III secretion system pore protein FliP [Lichenibacterium ramalinae]|nr:flagellar biosynthetic protein FliP [Lichenibacterium ramalinae]